MDTNGIISEILRLAKSRKSANAFEDAETACLAALKIDQHDLVALQLRADCLRESLNIAEAARAYVALTSYNPRHLWAHMYVGFHLSGLGLFADAANSFKTAADIDPSLAEAHFEHGRNHLLQQNFNSAVTAFENLPPTKSGYWLSTISRLLTSRDQSRKRAASSIRQGRTSTLTLDVLCQLIHDLTNLGKIRGAAACIARIRSESDKFIVIDAVHRFLTRAVSPDAASQFLTTISSRQKLSAQLTYLLATSLYAARRFQDLNNLLSDDSCLLEPLARLRFKYLSAAADSRLIQNRDRLLSDIRQLQITTMSSQFLLSLLFNTKSLNLHIFRNSQQLTPPDPTDIPYRIVQYWNCLEIPLDVLKCIDSWQTMNPTITTAHFTRDSARQFIEQNFASDVVRAFDRSHHPAMESDIFRLAFLIVNGGIYVDADEECISPIWGAYQSWKSHELVVVASPSSPYYLMNGFLASKPRSALLQDALDEAVRTINGHQSSTSPPDIWSTTGPGLLTRAFARAFLAGSPSDDAVAILGFQNYRQLCTERPLEYKTGTGNWRLIGNPPIKPKTESRMPT
ncbi:glycosyltransferase [Rhodopseudomonas palustris]|uniref:glycosyltransferase n=1 Tax=Rhodopseudomonas palustris TaxID=1076 RepID=UPI000E5AE80E|nr:glycosyltransferase [Rhodopseudomonas palustris]QLH71665.1 hypothetical protein HZF03_13050 [Rhodopseudomonas palustris]RIA02315.1 hypothetical protein D1920_08335 [Rhodopseudomonas palustris]